MGGARTGCKTCSHSDSGTCLWRDGEVRIPAYAWVSWVMRVSDGKHCILHVSDSSVMLCWLGLELSMVLPRSLVLSTTDSNMSTNTLSLLLHCERHSMVRLIHDKKCSDAYHGHLANHN